MSPNENHRCGQETRNFCLYTVYNNKTDMPVVIDGNAAQCAAAMGMSINGFYKTVSYVRSGKNKKWHIERYFIDEMEKEEIQ